MKRYLLGTVLLVMAATAWTGCDKSPGYRIEPRTVTESHIIRFDSLLLQYDNLADTASYRQMAESLAPFWNIYGRHILGLGDAPYFRDGIHRFLQDTTVARLYADTEQSFTDLSDEELAAVSAAVNSCFFGVHDFEDLTITIHHDEQASDWTSKYTALTQ